MTPRDDINEYAKRYERDFSRDFYVNDGVYQGYLAGKRSGVHFNSASIAVPFAEARAAARTSFEREPTLSDNDKVHVFLEARKAAAALINLHDERGVVFGRNTTEAASFVYWLAGLQKGDQVVLTNAENPSIRRLFELHLDHGNPKRDDGWSAWPTWYAERGPAYDDVVPSKTGVEVVMIEAITADIETFEQEMRGQINGHTKVFVFSHVLRDSGRELPARRIVESARAIKAACNPNDPHLFVLIDGAQALGNLPRVDFTELGCDAYIATPHKTMKSEVLGLLYFDPDSPAFLRSVGLMNGLNSNEQVVLQEMFDPRLGISPNVLDSISHADAVGFLEAIACLKGYGLAGNDFSKISEARQSIKDYFSEQLRDAAIGAELPVVDHPTSFILNFRLTGHNNRKVAEQMWGCGMFLSFIDRNPADSNAQYFRVSFQPDNTHEEVDIFISVLKSVIVGK